MQIVNNEKVGPEAENVSPKTNLKKLRPWKRPKKSQKLKLLD